jgi:integrase/recombinase XerD
MKSLHQSVRDYVKLRRSFGYKYGTEAKVLREFARFMSAQGLAQITTAAALRFAMVRPENKASTKAQRYAAVRHFAHDCRQHEDPQTERPPPKLVVGAVQRAKPYFCSELEIQRLLATAQHYRTPKTLLPVLYHCLFGLLVVTGMRVGEALGLEDRDIDWENALLTIRGAKFGTDRLVPLHPSVLERIRGYQETRDRLLGQSPRRSARLFVTSRGTALSYVGVYYVFLRVRKMAGLDRPVGLRMHHLRHRFAVETLRRWYQHGEPIDRRLPVLATYLGHSTMEGTYWYLSCTPALMAAAAERLDQRWEGGQP